MSANKITDGLEKFASIVFGFLIIVAFTVLIAGAAPLPGQDLRGRRGLCYPKLQLRSQS